MFAYPAYICLLKHLGMYMYLRTITFKNLFIGIKKSFQYVSSHNNNNLKKNKHKIHPVCHFFRHYLLVLIFEFNYSKVLKSFFYAI